MNRQERSKYKKLLKLCEGNLRIKRIPSYVAIGKDRRETIIGNDEDLRNYVKREVSGIF